MLDRAPEDILREEQKRTRGDPDSPWQRLLSEVTHALGNRDEAFNFATGMDFGFAIAIRHPEYAVAMRRAIQEGGMTGATPTEELVDGFISAVPIEIQQEGEPR